MRFYEFRANPPIEKGVPTLGLLLFEHDGVFLVR